MEQVQQQIQEQEINDKAKVFFIVGDVDETMAKEFLKFIFETDWLGEDYKELTIYIASEGGSLPYCFAIIDAINLVRESFNVHVTTFGLGETASAGFFLLISGDTRKLFPNCMVFVHEHLTVGSESSPYSERKRVDRDQDKIYAMYIEYTSKRLGITKEKARHLLKKNRYLKKSELIAYNIITRE